MVCTVFHEGKEEHLEYNVVMLDIEKSVSSVSRATRSGSCSSDLDWIPKKWKSVP